MAPGILVLTSVSLVLIRKRSLVRFAIAGLVCSLAILIIVLPGIFTERLELTANRLTREGVWFSPKHYDVDLDGLAFIHESTAKGAFHQPKVFMVLQVARRSDARPGLTGLAGAWGGGWSAGKDASSTAAKEHALAECRKRSDQARLLTCVCSFRAGEE
jgi:hypothetical protein